MCVVFSSPVGTVRLKACSTDMRVKLASALDGEVLALGIDMESLTLAAIPFSAGSYRISA